MTRDRSAVLGDPLALVGAKKKTQSSKSWIRFDATGQGTSLDVDKYDIMQRVGIHARDLRIIDPLLSYPSTILVREHATVLNLVHIKAIITAEEEIWLRDPTDESVIPVVQELQRRLPPLSSVQHLQQDGKEYPGGQHDLELAGEDESPFEFRALEVALEDICSFLAERTMELETIVHPTLDELTSKVRYKLAQLLNDDDDMAGLYLSRKLVGISSPASGSCMVTVHGDENDVEDVEMLLEAYFIQIDSTLSKSNTVNTVYTQQDTKRNKTIQLSRSRFSNSLCSWLFSCDCHIRHEHPLWM